MLKVDLHTHTLRSDCGLSTLFEMAKEASKRKLKILGTTDHGPFFPPKNNHDFVYFGLHRRVPKHLFGVRIVFGVEANILDEKGGLGLPDTVLENMPFVAAGFHSDAAYEDKGVKKNTQAVLEVMKHPYVKVITHPYLDFFKVDIEKIAEESCKRDVLLEVNNTYLGEHKMKKYPASFENAKKMIRVVQETGWKLILASDAHIATEVGNDSNIRKYKKELGLKDKYVINNEIRAVKEFFNID